MKYNTIYWRYAFKWRLGLSQTVCWFMLSDAYEIFAVFKSSCTLLEAVDGKLVCKRIDGASLLLNWGLLQKFVACHQILVFSQILENLLLYLERQVQGQLRLVNLLLRIFWTKINRCNKQMKECFFTYKYWRWTFYSLGLTLQLCVDVFKLIFHPVIY